MRQSRWISVSWPTWFIDKFGITKGNRGKCIVAPLQDEFRPSISSKCYFWKESLPRYPLEFWSEIFAYQIAPFCSVPVAVNWPATLQHEDGSVRIGSLSRFLVNIENDEYLEHGGDILSRIKPEFRRKKGEDHSVQLCLLALFALEQGGSAGLVSKFFRQLVFDALIGNSDRHQENWGFGVTRKVDQKPIFRLLPAFDNGTSLGRELNNEKLNAYCNNQNLLDKYIEKGRAHIRWEEGGRLSYPDGDESKPKEWQTGELEQMNHEQLLSRFLLFVPQLRKAFDQVLSFDESLVIKSIERVVELSNQSDQSLGIRISDLRAEFIIKSIMRRRERLGNL
jgi:hypothetical protein